MRYNVIFLDIDGVLVTSQSMLTSGAFNFCRERLDIFDKLIERLNGVYPHVKEDEKTYTRIVISSTWRMGRKVMQLKDLFHNQGSRSGRYIIGKTGKDKDCRGLEIKEWLSENCELGVDKYVIIDDDSDMLDLSTNLVKTEWESGLQQIQADQIFNYFNSDAASFQASISQSRINKESGQIQVLSEGTSDFNKCVSFCSGINRIRR